MKVFRAKQGLYLVKEKIDNLVGEIKSFSIQQEDFSKKFNSFLKNQNQIVETISELINEPKLKMKLKKMVSNFETEMKSKVKNISEQILKAQEQFLKKEKSKGKTSSKSKPVQKNRPQKKAAPKKAKAS